MVVEFKRGVYEMALTELARFLPRAEHRNRYLRGGVRPRDHGALPPIQTSDRRERHSAGASVESAGPSDAARAPRTSTGAPPGLEIES